METHSRLLVNSTISIDLSKSWTIADVAMRTIPKDAPVKVNEALWTDHEAGVFYTWAGTFPFGIGMGKSELWKFSADGDGGGSWTRESPRNPDQFDALHTTEFHAMANTDDTGFAFGGTAKPNSEQGREVEQAVPGMVTFQHEDEDVPELGPWISAPSRPSLARRRTTSRPSESTTMA